MTTKKIISLILLCSLVAFSCVLAYCSATIVVNEFGKQAYASTAAYAKGVLYSLEVSVASLWAYIPLLFGIFCFLSLDFTPSKRINFLFPLAFLSTTAFSCILPVASTWIKKGIPEYSSATILVFFSHCIVTLLLCAGFAALAWFFRKSYNKHVAGKLHFSLREMIVLLMCLQVEFGILIGVHFLIAVSGLSIFVLYVILVVAPYAIPIIAFPILVASGIIWSILAKKEKPVCIFGNAVHLILSFGVICTIIRATAVEALLQKLFELTIFRGEDYFAYSNYYGSAFLEEIGFYNQILYVLFVFLIILALFAIYIAIASLITFICKTIKKKKAAKQPALDIDSYFADYYD